jgi:hypothetical protein
MSPLRGFEHRAERVALIGDRKMFGSLNWRVSASASAHNFKQIVNLATPQAPEVTVVRGPLA